MVVGFSKLAGDSNPHIRLLKRMLGGMVADFPNLAGDNSIHIWQQDSRTQSNI